MAIESVKVDIDQFYKKMIDAHKFELKEKKLPNYIIVYVGSQEYHIPKDGSGGYLDGHNRVNSFLLSSKNIPEYVSLKPMASLPTPKTISLYDQCKTSSLKVGSKGQCVTYAQQKLQEWGFYTRQVDGDYGEYTKQAVIAFQKATSHTPDGVLGPKTWSSFPTYTVPKVGVLKGDEWVLSTLRSKGNVETDQGLRDLLAKYGTYLYYYNQRQNQQTTVSGLKGNCADLVNDLGLPYYRARGIPCRGVHCQVRCLDGKWYGHYIIEIGPQGSGKLRDPAGWCKGKGLTELICGNGYEFLHYEGDNIP